MISNLDNNKFTIEEIKLLVKVEQPTLNVLSLGKIFLNKIPINWELRVVSSWPKGIGLISFY